MNENKNHFLDTSVILTGLTKWRKEELYPKANEYFDDKKFKRVTSIRVFSEARSVINNCRRVYTQFLQKMFEDPSKINPMDVEGSLIFQAKKLFIESFEHRIIVSYIKACSGTIFSAVTSNAETFEKYLNQIRSEIQNGLMELILVCQPRSNAKISMYDKCPSDHSKYYSKEFQELENKINYSKDTEVILDAYFISKKINQKLSLITLDTEHMLSNKDHIEATLQTIKVCDFRHYNKN
ncbi:MAG: hypothetical protein ABIH20_02750 [Candidatus Diapherotrites archaeon]